MARIRTIKPEFWTDEKMSLLDVTTRLVFIGLVSMADDAGRLVDNVKLLDGQLFPSTDDTCRDALDTLARMGRILRYRSESGQSLIQIIRWDAHQKVDKPSKYVLPAPTDAAVAQAVVDSSVKESSRDSREDSAKESRDPRVPTLDLGPTTNDPDHRPQGGGGEQPVSAPRDLVAIHAYAVDLTRCANEARDRRWGEQITRINIATAMNLAEDLIAAGVSITFAKVVINSVVDSLSADPADSYSTVEYFRKPITKALRKRAGDSGIVVGGATASTPGDRSYDEATRAFDAFNAAELRAAS